MRGASLQKIVGLAGAFILSSTIAAQEVPPVNPDPTAPDPAAPAEPPRQSSGVRDRDPVLEGAKRIASELQQANFKTGNLYILSRIRLSDIGFTEEFFVPTGDHGGGLAVSVEAPQRLYYVPTKKVVFSAEVTPGVSYFSGADDNQQFNYRARAGVQFLFNKLFLDFYGLKFDELRARVGDINRLATTDASEYGLGGELKYSSRSSLLFSARYNDTAHPLDRFQPYNEENGVEVPIPVSLLDRVERRGRATFVHKTFPLTSLTMAAEVADYGFDFATYKDGTFNYLAPGFIYDSGRMKLRLEAGPARLRFDDRTQHDFEGILGELEASRDFRRTTVTLGASRDVDFSIFADNNFYVSNRVAAAAEYATTRRLKLRVSSSAQRDVYEVPVFGAERRDNTSFSTIGFRYTLRRIQTGIDLGWYERDSTFEGDDESGIRYVLHLSFSP